MTGLKEVWTGDRPVGRVPFVYRRRMHWGDGDAARIGYTGRFVEYGIEAAECWWEAVLGTGWLQLHEERNLGAPAVSLGFDFRHPVRPGQFMDIEVRVERLGRASLALAIAGRLTDGTDCFSGRFVSSLVVPGEMRSTPYPADMRARIERHVRDCDRHDRGIAGPQDVLDVWFADGDSWRDAWFTRSDDFDAEIRRRFLATAEAAAAGELDEWSDEPESALALTIALDQFPRNLFRGQARAFAGDAKARSVARKAIAAGFAEGLPLARASFLYLPFEHSEDLDDQDLCLDLFRRHLDEPKGEDCLRYAAQHRAIIARFGRFPHRNAALGRESTAEEAAFLKEPGSSF